MFKCFRKSDIVYVKRLAKAVNVLFLMKMVNYF
ncbi:hypothetical protein BHO_0104800 [Borrelia hermsii YBT]|nr:hypothetical protein BHO_0104800 [Borrelia hermsii YBT]